MVVGLIGMQEAWNDPAIYGSRSSPDIVIAVLDSGIDAGHPDLVHKMYHDPSSGGLVGWSVFGGDPFDDIFCPLSGDTPDAPSCFYALSGHGTEVAGVAAAEVNNAEGIAGMAWDAMLVPVKLGGCSCAMSAAGIALALGYVRSIPVRANRLGRPSHVIVNISAGHTTDAGLDGWEQSMGDILAREGYVMVAASGNEAACDGVISPARLREFIAVGQSEGNCRSNLSNGGPQLTVVAPSRDHRAPMCRSPGCRNTPCRAVNILPCNPGGAPYTGDGYPEGGGTSLASPMVAGIAAVLVEQNPDWFNETVRRRLIETAVFEPACMGACGPSATPGFDPGIGYGRVDAYHALGGPPAPNPACASNWLYLSDSRTILETPAPASDYRYHAFPTALLSGFGGGHADFRVTVANPGKASATPMDIASVWAEVTRPDGTVDPLKPTLAVCSSCAPLASCESPSGTVIQFCSTVPYTVGDNVSFREARYLPEIVAADTAGNVARIPAPAIVVPGATPVSVEATLLPPVPNAVQDIVIRIRVLDALGRAITSAPVQGIIIDAPVPDPGKPDAQFKATSYRIALLESGVTDPWVDFVIRPSSKAGPYIVSFGVLGTAAGTQVAFTTVAGGPMRVVMEPQYETVVPGGTTEIRAHLEDNWGNRILNPSPAWFCLSQITSNSGALIGSSTIDASGELRQMFQAGTAGSCDTVQAAVVWPSCGWGTPLYVATTRICGRWPESIAWHVAPDRVPTGGPVQMLIEPLSSDGLVVGGVSVKAEMQTAPAGATPFLADFHAAALSPSGLTLTSDSPGETVFVLHTGEKPGGYDVKVSLAVYPSATPITVRAEATRDWLAWRRDQSQNPVALGEILKPPLKLTWTYAGAAQPDPTGPLMEGGAIFTACPNSITALGSDGSFTTSLPYGLILPPGPMVASLFERQRLWEVLWPVYGLKEFDFDGFAFIPGPAASVYMGYTMNATVVDGPTVIETGLGTIEELTAFDALSLTKHWRITREGEASLWRSPPVAFGRIFLPYTRFGQTHLGAFDVRTGDLLWSTNMFDFPLAPLVTTRDSTTGQLRVIAFGRTAIRCFEGRYGTTLWTYGMPPLLNCYLLHGNLVVAHNRVYVLYTVQDPVTTGSLQYMIALNLADGTYDAVFNPTVDGYAQALAAANGFLYVADYGSPLNANRLQVYDWTTGAKVEEHPFIGSVLGLAVTNTMILVQSDTGLVTAWGAGVNCPKNVRGKAQGQGILLQWETPVEGTWPISAYRVLRATGANVSLGEVGHAWATATTYLDATPACGVLYYYQVLAVDTKANESERCELVVAKSAGADLVAVSLAMLSKQPFECAGDTGTFRLTVRNDGLYSATSMTGVLEIPKGSATMITGTGIFTPSTLGPGMTGTVTWLVMVTSGGPLELRGSAIGVDACSGTLTSSSSATYGPININSATLNVSVALPGFVNRGVTFTVTITAYNAGTEPAKSVTPFVASTPGSPYVQPGKFNPKIVGNLAPGSTAYFTAQVIAVQSGKVTLAAGVWATACHAATKFPAPPATLIVGRASLAIVSAIASPAAVCPGDTVTAVYTVSNTGDGWATGIRAATFDAGTKVAPPVVSPLIVASLGPGAATTFTFSYTALSSGLVGFRSRATGNDTSTGAFLASANADTNTVRISDNTMTVIAAGGGAVSVGATVYAVVTVTNTSGMPVSWVRPALAVSGPPAVLLSTPSPASVTGLADGASAKFTWRYRVDGWGVLNLAASATATICGSSVGFTGSGMVHVGRASLAGTSLTVRPPSPCPNETLELVLGVTNTGDAAVVNVTPGVPGVWTVDGTATASLVAAPPVLTMLAPGASAEFTWTYLAGPGTGTLRFLASATGTDPVSGNALTFDQLITDPVEVSRHMVITASVPDPVTRGVPFALIVTFTNGASSPATVSPNAMYIPAGGSLIASQTGPVPAGTFTVTPGGLQTFTWTFVTNGMGGVIFNPSLTVTACGFSGATGPGELAVTSFNGGGDWPMWGHDAQHTFRQPESTPLDPPLEELWSAPGAAGPIVVGNLSYWLETNPPLSTCGAATLNRLVARRVLDGAPVWCVAGAFFPPAMACDGNTLYVVNGEGSVDAYDAHSGHLYGMRAVRNAATNLTIDNGNLYCVSPGGLSIFSSTSGTEFTRSAAELGGSGFKLLDAPPLVVNGAMVVIGIWSGGGRNPRLMRIGPPASPGGVPVSLSVALDILPTSGLNAGFLSFDGKSIIVTGSSGGDTVVTAYDPNTLGLTRSYVRNYSGEAYGPALAATGDIVVRRNLPPVTFGGVQYNPSSSLQLRLNPGGFSLLGETEPLWWGGFGILAGRSAVANGYAYHEAMNMARYHLPGEAPDARPVILHTVRLVDSQVVWTPTSIYSPEDWSGPAVARGLLFMNGGHVFGPRTIDPPEWVSVASILKGASLSWSPPVLGASDVDHYEVYRADTAKGQIWAGAFENPAVTPAPVLIKSTKALTFDDGNLIPGRTYWYAVRAVTKSGRPPTSWFTPEQDVMPGGLVVEISSPQGCDVASGNGYPVMGKAYYNGLPNLFQKCELRVDGVLVLSSTSQYGNQYSLPVLLKRVNLSASSCHTITLVAYLQGAGSHGASTFVTVGGNHNLQCSGCAGSGAVTIFSEHRHPEGMATDASDFVYVVDSLRHRVERFDAEGRLLWEIGNPDASGKDPDGLKDPIAAAIAQDGSLYITDRLRRQVVVYDEDGGFRFAFGAAGAGPGMFREPSGIALDPAGRLWVADRLADRLQQFTLDGTFVSAVGRSGSGIGQLKQPVHLWVESSGTVWVADSGNDRVCAFDRDGHFLRAVGTAGKAEGELAGPAGVAVDTDGRRLFVSDTGNDRIEVFDADAGSFLWSFGTAGTAINEMRHPGGLALDTQISALYVADTLNNRGDRWPLRLAEAPDFIPPRAELIPSSGESVERGMVVAVQGRSVDAHFARYRLTLTGAGTTSVLVESSQPVWLGVLGEVKTSAFLPGSYRLDLVVEDRAGLTGKASRYLGILPKPEPLVGIPPSSPAGR